MKNEWDTWNDMSDAERMRAWWSIRDALRVYGGHIPPCKGRPCECGFREAWKMAGLPVTTTTEPPEWLKPTTQEAVNEVFARKKFGEPQS